MADEELNPDKILKLSGSYWETCTLHAGVKLDVFTIIGKDHLRGEDVAVKLNGDKRGVKMLLNALSVLEPGGMILIHEFILNNSMDSPLFPALFSLNMLLGTPSGQSYSEQQIQDMLSDAGVREIRRIFFESPNDSGIITGIV